MDPTVCTDARYIFVDVLQSKPEPAIDLDLKNKCSEGFCERDLTDSQTQEGVLTLLCGL